MRRSLFPSVLVQSSPYLLSLVMCAASICSTYMQFVKEQSTQREALLPPLCPMPLAVGHAYLLQFLPRLLVHLVVITLVCKLL